MEEKNKRYGMKIVPILCIILAVIITYLPYFKNSFGIDTSTMIMNQNQMLNGYLSQGRFGIVWLFELFIRHYNNQLIPFIVSPLLVIAGIYLYHILKKYDKATSSFAAALFSIAFICNPIVYGQLYFKMQAFQILVGLFCVLLGVNLSLARVKMPLKIVAISVLFSFSLLIYQVFAFFIFSMILFCLYFFKEKRKEILQTMLSAWVIAAVIYFLSYFVGGLLIHYSSYGNETYMMWNKLAELSHLQKFGLLVIALLSLFYLVLIILILRRARAKKEIEALLLTLFLTSILTFNMAFGNVRPAPRVYFGTFSIVFASLLYLAVKKGGWLKYGAVVTLLLSMGFTFSLSTKANVSYKNDQLLTQNIVTFTKENKISQKQTNLVFIGNLQVGNQGMINKFQDVFITGATRTSFFQFDPALTTLRPYDFMKIEGYDFKIPDQNLRATLALKYKNLPDYPSKESMIWDKNERSLVVKLSN